MVLPAWLMKGRKSKILPKNDEQTDKIVKVRFLVERQRSLCIIKCRDVVFWTRVTMQTVAWKVKTDSKRWRLFDNYTPTTES